jgi:hypothetical protein
MAMRLFRVDFTTVLKQRSVIETSRNAGSSERARAVFVASQPI